MKKHKVKFDFRDQETPNSEEPLLTIIAVVNESMYRLLKAAKKILPVWDKSCMKFLRIGLLSTQDYPYDLELLDSIIYTMDRPPSGCLWLVVNMTYLDQEKSDEHD